jgi:hypothetical protein
MFVVAPSGAHFSSWAAQGLLHDAVQFYIARHYCVCYYILHGLLHTFLPIQCEEVCVLQHHAFGSDLHLLASTIGAAPVEGSS